MSGRDRRSAEAEALGRAGKLREAAAAARAAVVAAKRPEARAWRALAAADWVLQAEGAVAARVLVDQAAAAAVEAGDRVAAALARAELARLELFGRDAGALERAEALLDAAAREGDGSAAATARVEHYRGLLASRRGEPAASVEALRRAYRASDGDPAERARILNTWGLQLEAWGDPEEARRLLERSLEIKLELEDHWGTAATYGTLAFLHMRQGAHAEARDALARDLEIAERIGSAEVLPNLHVRLAAALLGLGRVAGAEREVLLGLALLGPVPASVPARRAEGFGRRELARVRLAQGRLDEAAAEAAAARERFEALAEPYGTALARLVEAEIALARRAAGDEGAAAANAAVESARPVFAALGAVQETAEALILAARIERVSGRGGAAAAMMRDRVLPLLERLAPGTTHLRRAAAELLVESDEEAPGRRLEVLAGWRRAETSLADGAGRPQEWTVVAGTTTTAAAAARFAAASAAEGGVTVWFPPDRAVSLLRGTDGERRGKSLRRRLRGMRTAAATGAATLESPWPAGPRASGPAVAAALRGCAGARGSKR